MRKTRRILSGAALAAGLTAGAVVSLAAAHGPQGPGYGHQQQPGYGMGPGMMGQAPQGYGQQQPGYGMGPGMMGQAPQGYGQQQPGYGMGPGMMGQAPQGYGQQQPGYGMGPGMMAPGYGSQGMMRQPGMGWGPGQAAPADLELSVDAVRQRLQRQLDWHANPRLQLGDVTETDDDTIVAEIVTKDGSLVQKLAIDRHNGSMRQMEE